MQDEKNYGLISYNNVLLCMAVRGGYRTTLFIYITLLHNRHLSTGCFYVFILLLFFSFLYIIVIRYAVYTLSGFPIKCTFSPRKYYIIITIIIQTRTQITIFICVFVCAYITVQSINIYYIIHDERLHRQQVFGHGRIWYLIFSTGKK